MPRKTLSVLERIRESENKIKSLVEQRNKDLLALITECKAITIDDRLLAGFLLFATNTDNKDHPLFKEFIATAEAAKIPGKNNKGPKQRSAQKTKKTD